MLSGPGAAGPSSFGEGAIRATIRPLWVDWLTRPVRSCRELGLGARNRPLSRKAAYTAFPRGSRPGPAGQSGLESGGERVMEGELAGGLGFEPRLAESESAVLPLNYPPAGAAGQKIAAGDSMLTRKSEDQVCGEPSSGLIAGRQARYARPQGDRFGSAGRQVVSPCRMNCNRSARGSTRSSGRFPRAVPVPSQTRKSPARRGDGGAPCGR